ncbi:hypothetical protein AAG570_010530 [Ranatra chinensis]|uniref:TP53-regulated inhibitor of apoptosis 1 n=1 Tax=Ranatra chinensis TaxID=642074 RepID=A0ABD0Z8W7_9HEMI
MNSIGKSCNDLKEQYDECFKLWFTEKFLKGYINDDTCSPVFKLYQQCVKVNINSHSLKEEYDACFNTWFSQKFLRGDHNDEMCAHLLKVYKQCVEVLYATLNTLKY